MKGTKLNRITAFILVFFFCSFSLGLAQADPNQTQTDPNMNYKADQTLPAVHPFENNPFQNNPAGSNSPIKTLSKYQQSQRPSPLLENGAKGLSAVDPARYSIQPGDTLSVEMWTPVHSVVQGVVSAMGTVNLDPVGDVHVQGVLLNRLSQDLEETLKKYYKRVQVNAQLIDVRTVKVRVLGEVKQPGGYDLSGVTGALDAIEKAGGLEDKASLRNIELKKDGKVVSHLDYFKWRMFGDQNQDPYLEPNEVVYVPVEHNVVAISGEVNRPGSYEMLPGETFADLIRMSGGYTPEALQSEVKVSRISGPSSQVNLSASETLPLQNGDAIYVPPMSLFQKKIKVMGEVVGSNLFTASKNTVTGQEEIERVGWYRLHSNEKVQDVILNLGGFTSQADPGRAWIERKEADGAKKIIPVNLHKLFAENDQTQNIPLKDGDTLVIPPSANSVYVVGDVNHPGVFPYTPGNGLQDYVTLAGGPTPHGVITHVKLVREIGGSAKPMVKDVNLKAFLVGEKGDLPLLEPGDVIYVPHTAVAGINDILGFLTNFFFIKQIFGLTL